ncbi:serine hydrolase [Mycetocola sp.]|uniref:serine hydrolase n=1 Tax=Mycetocola sp. TaxID=1871042 RepID=UPI002A2012A3|nr:serine hydrolase [Mycetocola sp.]MCU1560255.1 serine hydrolase [Mycetocola sp.]
MVPSTQHPAAPQPYSRTRQRERRRARHRSAEPAETFARSLKALGFLARNGVLVSARVTDLSTGAELLSVDDYVVMPTASIGKVLLLIDVAARLSDTEFAALTILDRESNDSVGNSGIWQHLQAPSLPVADLAALIGATSDNLATNVLLRLIGLDSVSRRAESIGLKRTALLDRARDKRGPDDAPHLSVGSMKEIAWLFSALARGEIVDQATSQRVAGWLSLNTDLSMVASAFGMDPLSHRSGDHGMQMFNKTGVDPGVRADAGVVRGPRAGVAYAVAVSFADTDLSTRLAVYDALHTLGLDLVEYIH